MMMVTGGGVLTLEHIPQKTSVGFFQVNIPQQCTQAIRFLFLVQLIYYG